MTVSLIKTSSPNISKIPQHVAIVMDGNGRWAARRFLPRTSGHIEGIQAACRIAENCGKLGVRYLTLFAFSSENWRRPPNEVSVLMCLFCQALEREVDRLKAQGIRLHIIGDLSVFENNLQDLILDAQARTAHNNRMHLTIAANYGGRWDIIQAVRALLIQDPNLINNPQLINEESLSHHLSMSWAPEPDLFIRTGGEHRISNFLMWQLTYTELYFTDSYWPDFSNRELEMTFEWYKNRERRFGQTSEQLFGKRADYLKEIIL